MADILDFEELMKDLENERKSEKKEKKSSTKQPVTRNEIKSNYSFLYNLSKTKIEHYIKGTTKYKTINKQIQLLTTEMVAYRKAGRKDLEQQTKAMIDSLRDSIKDLNAFASEKNVRSAYEGRKKELENSPRVKALRAELKQMKDELKDIRPSSVYRKLKDLRKRLNINTATKDIIIDLDDDELDFDDLDNLDALMNETDNELQKEYIALCNYIAEYIGHEPEEVSRMNASIVYKELLQSKMKEEYDDKKSKYSDKKEELMTAISSISSDSISKVVYDNFDFEIESDVNDAMDLLAASRTTFVANMAYVFCKKYGVIEHVDEIVGYGLMALSEALNRWKKFQKQAYEKDKNNIIDIDIFLGVNITGPMIKGIYEIKNKGMIHPSTSIGLDMKSKEGFEKFKKDNPDLAGLPEEQIQSVYQFQMLNNSGESGNVLSRNVSVSSESEFGQLIASSIEEDGGDLWSNMLIDRKSLEEFDAINDFDDILKILEIIFSLYKLNYDKKTGAATKSNKMFFDKVDYAIFRKIIGIEVNEADQEGRWTQQQVAEALTKEFGRSFTQGAVGNRLDKIYKAIKVDIIKDYPNLEGALKDLKQYFLIRSNISIFQSKIAKDINKFKKVENNILSRLK